MLNHYLVMKWVRHYSVKEIEVSKVKKLHVAGHYKDLHSDAYTSNTVPQCRPAHTVP